MIYLDFGVKYDPDLFLDWPDKASSALGLPCYSCVPRSGKFPVGIQPCALVVGRSESMHRCHLPSHVTQSQHRSCAGHTGKVYPVLCNS